MKHKKPKHPSRVEAEVPVSAPLKPDYMTAEARFPKYPPEEPTSVAEAKFPRYPLEEPTSVAEAKFPKFTPVPPTKPETKQTKVTIPGKKTVQITAPKPKSEKPVPIVLHDQSAIPDKKAAPKYAPVTAPKPKTVTQEEKISVAKITPAVAPKPVKVTTKTTAPESKEPRPSITPFPDVKFQEIVADESGFVKTDSHGFIIKVKQPPPPPKGFIIEVDESQRERELRSGLPEPVRAPHPSTVTMIDLTKQPDTWTPERIAVLEAAMKLEYIRLEACHALDVLVCQ